MRHNHAIFQQSPISQTYISTGEVPTPYHIYDGNILLIGGTANLDAVKQLLQNEQVTPIQTENGNALMAVWVCDFTDASLQPHHELQFSIFASYEPTDLLKDHPYSILRAMVVQPDVKMVCHGLWNNTEMVVAYNRELLRLNARLMKSEIQADGKTTSSTFQCVDSTSGAPLASGHLRYVKAPGFKDTVSLFGALGWTGIRTFLSQPWLSLQVINPVGYGLADNQVAQTYTKNDQQVTRFFDPQHDQINIQDETYQALAFQPQFVSHSRGCRFVYLNPKPFKG